MKVSINKKLSELSPKKFETWFKNRNFDASMDWEKEYKKIGGKIEPKRNSEKGKKD